MPRQKFVNPLLRSSETKEETSTEATTKDTPLTPIQPSTLASTEDTTYAPTSTPKQTSTYTSTHEEEEVEIVRRKRGSQAFDKTHERFTSWIEKRLKKQFDKLAKDLELSKTELLNEAVADLLKKHGR